MMDLEHTVRPHGSDSRRTVMGNGQQACFGMRGPPPSIGDPKALKAETSAVRSVGSIALGLPFPILAAMREALVLVKAETVLRWDRERGHRMRVLPRFRRIRRGGRPRIDAEIRGLISRMARDNVLWGAPRVHGELLKLGIDIGQTSVAKYMVKG